MKIHTLTIYYKSEHAVTEATRLEDTDVVVDVGAPSLWHALGNPDNVASFLLAQSHVRVEHTKVKLINERQLQQLTLQQHGHVFVLGNLFFYLTMTRLA